MTAPTSAAPITPISWCRDYAGGRSFYTGMGRTAGSFSETGVKDHLLGAIQWTAGLVRGDCKATIDSNYKGTRIVGAGPEDLGLKNSGESHGLVVAPNGWVIYIGRGDCRTDAERGALLGGGPIGRILDHTDANVGIGCGNVHIWDPAQANGTVNSGITRAGTLAVYGDGGQGGERTDQDNHKMEYGLLGVTVAPDFQQTGTSTCSTSRRSAPIPSRPDCRSSGASRRCRSRASRASRSTCRRSSSTSTPRSGSSSTTRRSTAAATSAAAWASTRRATST